jgi:hypothetical protein
METQLPEQRISRQTRLGLGFWFQWIIANAAGLAIGMAIRQFMFGLGPWATNTLVVGAVVGAVLGVAQFINLREHVGRAGPLWVLSNLAGWAIGWSVGWQVGWTVFQGLGINEVFTLIGALAGTIGGVIQWLLLRKQLYQAGWWIIANAFGWAAGMAIGFAVGGAFGWPLIGAVAGAITGLPLIWLLRRPRFN